MEFLTIVRLLWDRRLIVAAGIVVAVAAGVLAGRASEGGSASGGSGVGSLRLVLDTSDSQLVAAAPKGASTLPTRAALLADVLATDTGTALVAKAARAPYDQLVVVGPAARRIAVVDSPLVAASSAAPVARDAPYVVEAIADGVTPIISIAAYAPDAARAGRLARAAAAGLRRLLARKDGTRTRGFVFDTVTPLATRTMVPTAHTRMVAAAGALTTFGAWCVLVVLGAGGARRMRQRATAIRSA
jgi:hypothetical protein